MDAKISGKVLFVDLSDAKRFLQQLTKKQIVFNMAIWIILAILLAFPFGFPNRAATLLPVIPSAYIHFYLVKNILKKTVYPLSFVYPHNHSFLRNDSR